MQTITIDYLFKFEILYQLQFIQHVQRTPVQKSKSSQIQVFTFFFPGTRKYIASLGGFCSKGIIIPKSPLAMTCVVASSFPYFSQGRIHP